MTEGKCIYSRSRKEQEKHTPHEPSKYKSFRNNTPGSRHSKMGWQQFLDQQNNPQNWEGSWPQVVSAPSSAEGSLCHKNKKKRTTSYSTAWTRCHPRYLYTFIFIAATKLKGTAQRHGIGPALSQTPKADGGWNNLQRGS